MDIEHKLQKKIDWALRRQLVWAGLCLTSLINIVKLLSDDYKYPLISILFVFCTIVGTYRIVHLFSYIANMEYDLMINHKWVIPPSPINYLLLRRSENTYRVDYLIYFMGVTIFLIIINPIKLLIKFSAICNPP